MLMPRACAPAYTFDTANIQCAAQPAHTACNVQLACAAYHHAMCKIPEASRATTQFQMSLHPSLLPLPPRPPLHLCAYSLLPLYVTYSHVYSHVYIWKDKDDKAKKALMTAPEGPLGELLVARTPQVLFPDLFSEVMTCGRAMGSGMEAYWEPSAQPFPTLTQLNVIPTPQLDDMTAVLDESIWEVHQGLCTDCQWGLEVSPRLRSARPGPCCHFCTTHSALAAISARPGPYCHFQACYCCLSNSTRAMRQVMDKTLYCTFWNLSTYDIYVPVEAYEKEIKLQKSQVCPSLFIYASAPGLFQS